MASNLSDSENKAVDYTAFESEEEDSDPEAFMGDAAKQLCVRVLVAAWARLSQTNSIFCRRFSNQPWTWIVRSYRSPMRTLLCYLLVVSQA